MQADSGAQTGTTRLSIGMPMLAGPAVGQAGMTEWQRSARLVLAKGCHAARCLLGGSVSLAEERLTSGF